MALENPNTGAMYTELTTDPSAPNTLPVAVGALTDLSSTAGLTAATLAAANASRRFLLIQNPTTNAATLFVDFGTTAVAASPSIEIPPGQSLFWEGSFVPTDSISIIASAAATAFTAKEG